MKRILALLALSLAGCQGPMIDPSPKAISAGDYTLIASACSAMPGQGGDICRVVQGSPIKSSWVLIMPHSGDVISGEVKVRYKDYVQSYAVTGPTVVIPWKDVVGHDTWQADDDGIAQATGTVRYKGSTDSANFVDVLGVALLVVLQPGYSPMPIDSGNQGWETTCRIQYSTAGRSAIECDK